MKKSSPFIRWGTADPMVIHFKTNSHDIYDYSIINIETHSKNYILYGFKEDK